jgi:hypothetical protein
LPPLPWALKSIAALGWFVSLGAPALSFAFDGERQQVLFGYQVLESGWFHLLVLEFSWLANFVFWYLVWLTSRRAKARRTIWVTSVLLILLTAQSLEIFIFDRFFEYPQAYAGYFVWFGSNLLLAAAALIGQPRTKERLAEAPGSR